MKHLSLEWKVIGEDQVALIFDKPTFMAFQTTAHARGLDTTEMIIEALLKLLGPTVSKGSGD